MRLFYPPAPPCRETGSELVARIGRLSHPATQLSVRWQWLMDWLWRHTRHRRRGTPVS